MRDTLQHAPQISDTLVFLHDCKMRAQERNMELTAENIALLAKCSTWHIRSLLRERDGVTGQRCGEVLDIR